MFSGSSFINSLKSYCSTGTGVYDTCSRCTPSTSYRIRATSTWYSVDSTASRPYQVQYSGLWSTVLQYQVRTNSKLITSTTWNFAPSFSCPDTASIFYIIWMQREPRWWQLLSYGLVHVPASVSRLSLPSNGVVVLECYHLVTTTTRFCNGWGQRPTESCSCP